MVEVKINPGICGLKTIVKAESSDMMKAVLTVDSECPSVMKLAEKVTEINAMEEVFAPFGTSSIFKEAEGTIIHAACPVPTAILKAVEAACGYALPADIVIEMKKE